MWWEAAVVVCQYYGSQALPGLSFLTSRLLVHACQDPWPLVLSNFLELFQGSGLWPLIFSSLQYSTVLTFHISSPLFTDLHSFMCLLSQEFTLSHSLDSPLPSCWCGNCPLALPAQPAPPTVKITTRWEQPLSGPRATAQGDSTGEWRRTQDCSVGRSTCHRSWYPEFNPRDFHTHSSLK